MKQAIRTGRSGSIPKMTGAATTHRDISKGLRGFNRSKLSAVNLALALAAGVCLTVGGGAFRVARGAPHEGMGSLNLIPGDEEDLPRLKPRYTQNNILLAVVDGEAVTLESLRGIQGETFDVLVQSQIKLASGSRAASAPDREQIELAVGYHLARDRALDIILLREAQRAGLDAFVQDVAIEANIDALKRQIGIDPRDDQAWARWTLQNLNKTPLEYREEMKRTYLRSLAREIMAGSHGPLRNLPLPVFFPLEVTPGDLREEYEREKTRWNVLRDIEYDMVSVELPRTASQTARRRVIDTLEAVKARFAAGDPIGFVETTLREEIEALKEPGIETRVFPAVTKASDAELDVIGEKVRHLVPGELSAVDSSQRGAGADLRDIYYFVRLNRRVEDVSRRFDDLVVQRHLRQVLLERKRNVNRQMVDRALLDGATVLPKTLPW